MPESKGVPPNRPSTAGSLREPLLRASGVGGSGAFLSSKERGLCLASLALCSAAVLCIGGVHPQVQLALSAGALLLTALYLFDTRERGAPLVAFAWPALLALSMTFLQLLPLPGPLVRILSPRAFALRAEVGSTALLPLTLDVPATLIEVTKGLACLGLLLMVGTLARRRELARSILLGVLLLGALFATLTIGQRLLGAQKIFGLYQLKETPGSGFIGSFVNGNHAASALTIFALVTAGFAAELTGGWRFASALMAVALSALVFYTGSRGGALGLCVGGGLFTIGLFVRYLGLWRGLAIALLLCGLGVSAGLFAADGLSSRLSSTEALVYNQKTRGWLDALRLVRDYPVTGVGRGAFEAPIDAYRTHDEGVRLVYPENVILQVSCEWGVPVATALFALCLLAAVRLRRAIPQLELSVFGAACALVAVAVHELFDFGLETLGVAFLTVLTLAVVVARSEELLRSRRSRRPRLRPVASFALLGVWLLALGGGAWASRHTLETDFERLGAAAKSGALADVVPELNRARWRHPADHHLELLAAEQALMARDPAALRHLNRALRLCPSSWQAHRLAARSLAAAHRPAQAAIEYRLALETGMPPFYNELIRVTGASVIEAVPSRTEDLLRLAAALVSEGRPGLADAACARAIELSTEPAVAIRTRLQLAVQSRERSLIERAARQLLQSASSAEDTVIGAEALDHIGFAAAADQAILAAMKLHSEGGLLVLKGAELRLARAELEGARGVLKQGADRLHTLAERRRAEELYAQIAERQGRWDEALLARSRARQLQRRQKETEEGSELHP